MRSERTGSGNAGLLPAVGAWLRQWNGGRKNRKPGKAGRGERVALAAAILIGAAAPAWAASTAPALVVEADHSLATRQAHSGTGRVNYDGHVVITHGNTVIRGAHAVVYTRHQRLEKAVVSGAPTRFSARPRDSLPVHGTAKEITYLAGAHQVMLEGDAALHRGKELFRAATVRYNLATQLIKAKGKQGGRVHVVIPPAGSTGGE